LLSTTIVRKVMNIKLVIILDVVGSFSGVQRMNCIIYFTDTNTVANTLPKVPTPATPDAGADDTIPGLTTGLSTPKSVARDKRTRTNKGLLCAGSNKN
jgi:hypothetical protein